MFEEFARTLHIHRAALGGVALALGLASGSVAVAASDYLLEIDGVKGESKDDVHKETIEIASWSWGATNPTTTCQGGGGAGQATFAPVRPGAIGPLVSAQARRQHYPHARLTVNKPGAAPLTIELEDVMITSAQPAPGTRGTAAGGLSFQSMHWSGPACTTR